VQMAGLWSDNVRLDLTTTTTWNDLTQTPRLSVMPITGNVGIGTTAPGARLELVQTVTNDAGIRITGSGTRRIDFVPNLGAGGWNPLSQAGDFGLIFTEGTSGTGNFVIGPWSASAHGIRITAAGNVGIGTVSPGARLEVAGNIIAAAPTASNHVATRGWVEAATAPRTMYATSATFQGNHNCDDVPATCCAPGYSMCDTSEIGSGRRVERTGTGRAINPGLAIGWVDLQANTLASDCNGWTISANDNCVLVAWNCNQHPCTPIFNCTEWYTGHTSRMLDMGAGLLPTNGCANFRSVWCCQN